MRRSRLTIPYVNSSRLFGALLVFLVLALVRNLRLDLHMGRGMEASIALGALIIIAWVCGDLFEKIKLPRITGYVITGMVLGPHLLNFITASSVSTLKFIDNIALALIGIHAGQEMRLGLIQRRFRSIISLSLVLLLFTVGGTFLFILVFGRSFLPFLEGAPWGILVVTAIIIAYLEGAKSPVSTIAVLDETRARGAMAETTLGAVIFKDLLMAVLLGVIIAVCNQIAHMGEMGHHGVLVPIFHFVFLSLLVGFAAGIFVGAVLRFTKAASFILIITLALCLTLVSHALHLEVLLVGGATGFVIENFSRKSGHFLEGLEQSTPLIYLLFFPVNGASLDLSLLGILWKAAIVILLLRFVLVFGGVWLWTRVGEDFPAMRRWGWTGFLNQESVTMALALILAHEFPALGEPIKALMLAMVVLTDLYAPAMFKYALYRSGEAG